MKRLKRFNEIQEQPKSGDYSYNDNGSVVHSDLLQSNNYGDLSMHNPYYDNGIKFFGPDGFKLKDIQEQLHQLLTSKPSPAQGE